MAEILTVMYVMLFTVAVVVFAIRRPTPARQLGQQMYAAGMLLVVASLFAPFSADNRTLLLAILISSFGLLLMIGFIVRGLIDQFDRKADAERH